MDRPNVLLIMADQLKATASHLYGNTFCQTPAMERLAQDGVLFEHAFTPHPLCVPARVSMWTAQYPHTHGARLNETLMPAGAQHAARIWKQAGYHLGLIGKNHCFAQPDDLALFDTWCEIEHYGLPEKKPTRGMEWFRPPESIESAHTVRHNMPRQTAHFGYATSDYPLEDYSTGLVAGQTVRFLEQVQDEPFTLWVSFPDPHTPYETPEQYAAMFPPEKIELPPWQISELDNAPERNRVLYQLLGIDADPLDDVYGVLAVYYGMVRFLDDGLGQILDALTRLGLREKTIVVFCADHGDFVGEHRMMRKGGLFYDCLTRVPLIISWPGHLPTGQVDDSMANLIDIVPTLLQLQGLDIPQSMQGQPLPTVTDAVPREATFSEYGAGGAPCTLQDLATFPQPYGLHTSKATLQWREAEGRRKMIRTRQWKYVHDPTGDKDELYNLADDPWELKNIIDTPPESDLIFNLRSQLLAWSILTEDALPVTRP
jgi:arylsulfatase A-like enzyme